MKKVEIKQTEDKSQYYFGRKNFQWMMIGLGFIALGFITMMGSDANTVDGVTDPNNWNSDIFSFRRIRLAPALIMLGFGIQVYAIIKRK